MAPVGGRRRFICTECLQRSCKLERQSYAAFLRLECCKCLLRGTQRRAGRCRRRRRRFRLLSPLPVKTERSVTNRGHRKGGH